MNDNDWEAMKQRLAEIAKNPDYVQPGEVDIWYDKAGHFCDVIWLTAKTFFTSTENKEVMSLIDDENNLYGFKIDPVEWMGDGNDGYTTVNLRSSLGRAEASGDQDSRLDRCNVSDGSEKYGNPMERGIINAKFDNDAHIFEVLWADGDARYVATENDHIVALVNIDGLLCGFRVIDIDRMSDDEHGIASVRLKTGIVVSPV